MRLRNETITLGLKRKALKPVLYERIDDKNVRIGTTWFKYSRATNWNILNQYGMPFFTHGVTIYGEGFKRFQANSWPDIKTDGTYEEFEESFNLWFNNLEVKKFAHNGD